MSRYLQAQAWVARAWDLWQRAASDEKNARQQRAAFYREMWRNAASQVGAEVIDEQGDLLTLERGSVRTRVLRNYTELDGPVTLRAAGDKTFMRRLLHDAGLPLPPGLAFRLSSLAPAIDFLLAHKPCVVKPASGTGAGAGVVTGVQTPRDLRRAAVAAAAHGSELLIEKQVPGQNLRLLFLDGELLDVVLRKPPAVIGDGRSTLATLIEQANRTRLAGGHAVAQVVLRRDLDMRRTLQSQRLSWRSVPASGRAVILKTVINDNAADENVSIIDRVSPALVELARQAADTMDVRLAGVDVITSDAERDPVTNGAVILEINTTPGLYIHRTQSHVPARILDACLEDATSRRSSMARRTAAHVGELP